MSLESYKPSKEEIQEAEENMTLKQEGMSLQREEDYEAVLKLANGNKIIEDLRNGKIDLKYNNDNINPKLSGVIGGSKIEITRDYPAVDEKTGNGYHTIGGTIDGEWIDTDLAKSILKRYKEVALLQDKAPKFLGLFNLPSNYEENAKDVAKAHHADKKGRGLLK